MSGREFSAEANISSGGRLERGVGRKGGDRRDIREGGEAYGRNVGRDIREGHRRDNEGVREGKGSGKRRILKG